MRLFPVNQLQMQITPRFIGKSLKKFPRQTKPERARHVLSLSRLAELLEREFVKSPPNQIRPPSKIYHASCQTFIHRHIRLTRERIPRIKPRPISANPPLI